MKRAFGVAAGALVLTFAVGIAQAGSAGHLDRSFGHRGHAVIRKADGGATAVALGPRGHIVVAGRNHLDTAFVVARLRHNGALDPTFGDGGVVNVPVDSAITSASSVLVDRDGGVVVAGTYCQNENVCHIRVMRFRQDGSPDPAFGTDGQVDIQYPDAIDLAAGAAFVQGGRIVVAGSTCPSLRGASCHITLAQLLPNGSLDRSFNLGGPWSTGGKVISSFGHPGCTLKGLTGDFHLITMRSGAQAMAIDPKGRILVGGTCKRRAPVALARFKPDGHIDRVFGRHGKLNTRARIDAVNALTTDSHQRIYVAGHAKRGIGVVRLGRWGGIDRSFGRKGRAVARFPSAPRVGLPVPHSIEFDSHRRIAVTGSAGKDGFAFARFTPNGRINRGFADQGRLITGRKQGIRHEAAGAIDSHDRVLAVGGTRTSGTAPVPNKRFALIRLLG